MIDAMARSWARRHLSGCVMAEVTSKETAEHIKAVGAEHLCWDRWADGNPSQPTATRSHRRLIGEGITREQIKTMGREVPGKLLDGLSSRRPADCPPPTRGGDRARTVSRGV